MQTSNTKFIVTEPNRTGGSTIIATVDIPSMILGICIAVITRAIVVKTYRAITRR